MSAAFLERRASNRLTARTFTEDPPGVLRFDEAVQVAAIRGHPGRTACRSVAACWRQSPHFGSSERLQPCREIGRLADNRLFLRRALADQIADDNQPGGDPDPHLEFGGFDG